MIYIILDLLYRSILYCSQNANMKSFDIFKMQPFYNIDSTTDESTMILLKLIFKHYCNMSVFKKNMFYTINMLLFSL